MIQIHLKKDYSIPCKWSELTPEDGSRFIALSMAMMDFERGRISFDQFKVAIVTSLLGIQLQKAELTENLEDNIFRLTDFTSFPYELDRESNVVYVKPLLCTNLLPAVGGEPGYRFSVSPEGIIDCDITAEQYVDSLELLQVASKAQTLTPFIKLFRTLYPKCDLLNPGEDILYAVYYNFRGILEWIKKLPDYDLVFNGPKAPSGAPASPLGLSGSIFTLAKAGYGDINAIKNMDLFSYLGLLVQQTIDSIHALVAMKLKPGEISDRLHLDVGQISPYLQN